MKLIVGMTGATGAPLGVALLQALREMPNVETHLVMSKWAKTTSELVVFILLFLQVLNLF